MHRPPAGGDRGWSRLPAGDVLFGKVGVPQANTAERRLLAERNIAGRLRPRPDQPEAPDGSLSGTALDAGAGGEARANLIGGRVPAFRAPGRIIPVAVASATRAGG